MENGYEIVENFLTKEEHQYYLDVCHEVYEKAQGNEHNHDNYSWNEPGNLNKVQGACNHEPRFLELASHESLTSRAKKYFNTKDTIDVYISKFFPMKPRVGWSTFMHQDNYYFEGDPRKIVSCGVYLEDTNKENGCLRLVKDSHKKGILPHDVESGISGISWIDEKILRDYEILDLELKSPYAVFFDINMVHGCYPNISDRTRFSLAWEYIETKNNDVIMNDYVWCDRNTI